MLVTERMQALGDHAKSSRQPPLKERRPPNASQRAAKEDIVDEEVLENAAASESAGAVIVGDVAPEVFVHENGNGAVAETTADSVAEIISNEDADGMTSATSVPEAGPLLAADDTATQAKAVQDDDDLSVAKRAIIHEWENWSALHSDELDDPNVTKYFFSHLEAKKSSLLNFDAKDKYETMSRWL